MKTLTEQTVKASHTCSGFEDDFSWFPWGGLPPKKLRISEGISDNDTNYSKQNIGSVLGRLFGAKSAVDAFDMYRA